MQVYGDSFFNEWEIILDDYSGNKQPETKLTASILKQDPST